MRDVRGEAAGVSLFDTDEALISPCGTYRYTLTRHLRGDGPVVLFGLCNPSVADHEVADPTLRKGIGFAERLFNARAVVIVNPYAYRATSPHDLRDAYRRGVDIVGPDNDIAVWQAVLVDPVIIVGWGGCAHGLPPEPIARFADRLRTAGIYSGEEPRKLHCLGRTSRGEPRHPLMLSYATPLETYEP